MPPLKIVIVMPNTYLPSTESRGTTRNRMRMLFLAGAEEDDLPVPDQLRGDER